MEGGIGGGGGKKGRFQIYADVCEGKWGEKKRRFQSYADVCERKLGERREANVSLRRRAYWMNGEQSGRVEKTS